MSVTLSYDVKGLANPITVHSEYTDASVNSFWATGLQVVQDTFELGTINDSDVLALFGSLTQFKLGAINGIDSATGLPVPTGQEPTGRRYYLTYGMADSLDRLLKSLESVGFDTVNIPVSGDPDRITQLQRWQDLDDVGLREILVLMGDAVANNRTLQALIELEYVTAGNNLIGENLEDLDVALTITRDVLDALERAQQLKNKLEAAIRDVDTGTSTPSTNSDWDITNFDEPPSDANLFQNPEDYNDRYERAMKTAFNEPLGVEINFSEADLTEFAIVMNDLGQARAQLLDIHNQAVADAQAAGVATENLPVQPPLIERLDTILGDMRTTPDGVFPVDIPDTNTQYNQGGDPNPLFGVIPGQPEFLDFSDEDNDISAVREDNLNRMLFWVYDGYGVSDQVDSGVYQRNLTGAITAAQNLNDTQKEDLRRFMYLFEQFYKSASAILQAIDRMVNKMAQNIKG